MSESNRELGKVQGVRLYREDRGVLTLSVQIEFRSGTQAFGGIQLDRWDDKKSRRVGTSAGTDLICRLLDLFNVATLDKIQGRYVYGLREASGGSIVGLELPEPDGGGKFLLSEWNADAERVEKNPSKG